MDRLNRMLQAAQGMGISAGGGPGGVSQPVALQVLHPPTRAVMLAFDELQRLLIQKNND